MGRTAKPLTILLTDPSMLEWPEFVKMREQGHILLEPGALTVDLYMGPRAHYLQPGMEKLIPVALRGARALKYAATRNDTTEKRTGT